MEPTCNADDECKQSGDYEGIPANMRCDMGTHRCVNNPYATGVEDTQLGTREGECIPGRTSPTDCDKGLKCVKVGTGKKCRPVNAEEQCETSAECNYWLDSTYACTGIVAPSKKGKCTKISNTGTCQVDADCDYMGGYCSVGSQGTVQTCAPRWKSRLRGTLAQV